jgi:hypothetical protein
LLTATASAAITVTNTSSGLFSTNGSGNFTINYDVINSGSVVVIGFYTDAGGSAVSSVGFGTGVGNQSSNQILSQVRSALAYFSDPSTTSGLSFSGIAGPNVANAGYFIWELSGVDLLAVAATAIGTNNATQITTTAANSFITSIVGINPFGAVAFGPDTTNSILTEVAEVDANSGIGGGWLGAGQAVAATTGVQELGWDVTGAGFGDFREMAFAFAPVVPEPSSAALALGGACFMFRRRRSRP